MYYSAEDMARKLNNALREAGYSTYFLENRKKPFPMQSETVEISLGVPNVFPPVADGDVLAQVREDLVKVTTDILRVPQSKVPDAAVACCVLNANAVMTRFYVQPNELVVVADHGFSYTNDAFIRQIIDFLPMFKDAVRHASYLLKSIIE